MKKLFLILCLFCLPVSGCATRSGDTVTQVSTIDALLAGVYDGHLTTAQLSDYGDFGLGTFNGLDGEMIMLNNQIFQVKADGKVYRPDGSVTTPFAAVSNFQPEKSFQLHEPVDFKKLQQLVDEQAPNQNIFCGILARGTFAHMKTRSVPAQTKPYPPLTEVVKNQPVFEMENVSGTIVGFRCPAYVKGINVPGYHLHFLSDDLTQGGHILEFTAEELVVELDALNKFFLILPGEKGGFDQVDMSVDREKELQEVEQ